VAVVTKNPLFAAKGKQRKGNKNHQFDKSIFLKFKRQVVDPFYKMGHNSSNEPSVGELPSTVLPMSIGEGVAWNGTDRRIIVWGILDFCSPSEADPLPVDDNEKEMMPLFQQSTVGAVSNVKTNNDVHLT
jgi:hypothetical protein